VNDPIQYLCDYTITVGNSNGYTTPGWYFWDETFSNCIGPYDCKYDCEEALKEYCAKYLGG
jgi:hypothetical protein